MNNVFVSNNINTLFSEALKRTLCAPDYVTKSRTGTVSELLNVTFVLKNPRNRLITFAARRFSLRYLAGELLFYFSGTNRLDMIKRYSNFWKTCSNDGRTIVSAYGNRLFRLRDKSEETQYEFVIKQLTLRKNSKRAVAVLYAPTDSILQSKDNPCTMFLQFFIRNGALILITSMRSNDAWFGFSYDIPFFTMLQESVYVKLLNVYPGLRLGPYIHKANSFHIYERNKKDVKSVVFGGDICTRYTENAIPALSPIFEKEVLKLSFIENKVRSVKSDEVVNFISEDNAVNVLTGWLNLNKGE